MITSQVSEDLSQTPSPDILVIVGGDNTSKEQSLPPNPSLQEQVPWLIISKRFTNKKLLVCFTLKWRYYFFLLSYQEYIFLCCYSCSGISLWLLWPLPDFRFLVSSSAGYRLDIVQELGPGVTELDYGLRSSAER